MQICINQNAFHGPLMQNRLFFLEIIDNSTLTQSGVYESNSGGSY